MLDRRPVKPVKTVRTLADLSVNESGRICCLQGEAALLDQLRELGFCEGERVEVKQTAPLNDPMVVEVLDYRLAIRRDEARGICIDREAAC